MKKDHRHHRLCRIGILVGSIVAYLAAFRPVYSMTGEVVSALTLIPIAMSAWVMGWKVALTISLISIPANTVLLKLAGTSTQAIWQLWPGMVVATAVGIIIGLLSNTLEELKERTREITVQSERLQSEIHKHEQTQTELARTNEVLEYEITELQRVDEALRENQRRLSTLLGNLPGMAYRCRNDRLWTMEFVSNGALALTGYTPDQLLRNESVSFSGLIHPEDRETLWNAVQVALAEQQPFQFVYRILAADGSAKWVWEQGQGVFKEDGECIAIEGFITDISKRKQAEDELVRLSTAIQQAGEAVFVTDANWTVQYVNPAFERLTGYAENEIVGQHVRTLRSYKHDSNFYSGMRDSLAAGKVWSGRIVNRRKDGTFYNAKATASPVRDKSGILINYVNIHRDISNEVRLERELLQARKMEAMGTLTGGIAHEFNNILGIIIGYTELAMSRGYGIPALQHDLTRVKDAGMRAADLIKQILTYSRQADQERRPIQVAPILKEALKLMRSVLPATIEIREEVAVGPEESAILSNPTEIHQVLMNLCTNAAHAMEGGGTLSVRLWNPAADDAVMAKLPESGNRSYLCLSVEDTGHGIPAEIVDRIFDPFFTTKGPGEGTGLGLSVVHGIVSGVGGTIVVDSEPGQGTTFHVFYPRSDAGATPKTDEGGIIPKGAERILLIDDEEALASMGEEILQSLGYRVCVKTDSIEALREFRLRPDAFDLVITDMTMPRLTGADLARDLIGIRPDIPVIILTGFSEKMNPEEASRLGIKGFLMKPVITRELARLIRQVLDRK